MVYKASHKTIQTNEGRYACDIFCDRKFNICKFNTDKQYAWK